MIQGLESAVGWGLTMVTFSFQGPLVLHQPDSLEATSALWGWHRGSVEPTLAPRSRAQGQGPSGEERGVPGPRDGGRGEEGGLGTAGAPALGLALAGLYGPLKSCPEPLQPRDPLLLSTRPLQQSNHGKVAEEAQPCAPAGERHLGEWIHTGDTAVIGK